MLVIFLSSFLKSRNFISMWLSTDDKLINFLWDLMYCSNVYSHLLFLGIFLIIFLKNYFKNFICSWCFLSCLFWDFFLLLLILLSQVFPHCDPNCAFFFFKQQKFIASQFWKQMCETRYLQRRCAQCFLGSPPLLLTGGSPWYSLSCSYFSLISACFFTSSSLCVCVCVQLPSFFIRMLIILH